MEKIKFTYEQLVIPQGGKRTLLIPKSDNIVTVKEILQGHDFIIDVDFFPEWAVKHCVKPIIGYYVAKVRDENKYRIYPFGAEDVKGEDTYNLVYYGYLTEITLKNEKDVNRLSWSYLVKYYMHEDIFGIDEEIEYQISKGGLSEKRLNILKQENDRLNKNRREYLKLSGLSLDMLVIPTENTLSDLSTEEIEFLSYALIPDLNIINGVKSN